MYFAKGRSNFKTRKFRKMVICANPFCCKIFYTENSNKQLKYCARCYREKEYLKLYKYNEKI